MKSKRITNNSGTVVSVVELDPWGGETNRSSNEAFQPKKFTSYLRDAIGSDDAMHRRYNRWWTRFEQPDPYNGSYDLTNPQSFNRFSYVRNDPANFIDPTGLEDCGPADWCIISTILPRSPIGGGRGNEPNFIPEDGPEESPTVDGPQEPQSPSTQDRLPFNTCDEFVNWLSELATRSVILMGVQRNNVNYSAKGFGIALAATAYYGYEKHIHTVMMGSRANWSMQEMGRQLASRGQAFTAISYFLPALNWLQRQVLQKVRLHIRPID